MQSARRPRSRAEGDSRRRRHHRAVREDGARGGRAERPARLPLCGHRAPNRQRPRRGSARQGGGRRRAPRPPPHRAPARLTGALTTPSRGSGLTSTPFSSMAVCGGTNGKNQEDFSRARAVSHRTVAAQGGKEKAPNAAISLSTDDVWLRGLDLNQRPLGYEPNELPDCSTPRLRIVPERARRVNTLASHKGTQPRFLGSARITRSVLAGS